MARVTLEYQRLYDNFSKLQSKFQGAVELLCENGAEKMEGYAKENRPWTDRTSRARQSLKGDWEKAGNSYKIQIAHGVSYGVWLETAHERRYAILLPTVNKVGYGEILPAFENFMEKAIKGI